MNKAQAIALDIVMRCGRFGVPVLLSPEPAVLLDGRYVSGWFDESVPRLVVATGMREEDWLSTLIHEYSHVTQWVEDCEAWRVFMKTPGSVDDWLDGKNVRNIDELVRVTQEMEADNERRSVRLIKELSAPINIEEYCRKANSYLHFHNIMREERKWYAKEKGPYQSPDIWPLFNPTIDVTFKTTATQRKALRLCMAP